MHSDQRDQERRPGAAPEVAGQVRVFCVLWALAHLAHLLRKGDPGDPLTWVVLGTAVLMLDRPGSRRRLGALAVAQLAYLYGNLPATDNHLIIMGFVNLCLLAALLLVRPAGAEGPAPVAAAFPYVRLAIVLAYGAAALAKLNRGFFDLTESCAVSMYHDATAILGGRVPDLPPSLESLLPAGVAAVELAIPVLLLVPATRLVGLGVLVLFHWVMSLSPTATAVDFTIVLFALAFLFLPAAAADVLTSRVRAVAGALGPGARMVAGRFGFVPVPGRPVALVLLTVGLAATVSDYGLGRATVAGNRNWLWLALAALVLGTLLLDAARQAWRQRWPRQAPGTRAGGRALLLAQALCLTLLVANAASPYLGGKTRSTFTMYSNLQTEAVESNHFLFPRLPVETGQDDLVLVAESSNDRLHRLGAQGQLVTWHELRRQLAEDPEASITYVRGGQEVNLARAHDDPELVTMHPVSHRFISHRVFDPERPRCRW